MVSINRMRSLHARRSAGGGNGAEYHRTERTAPLCSPGIFSRTDEKMRRRSTELMNAGTKQENTAETNEPLPH